MKLQNALAKLNKSGYNVQNEDGSRLYRAIIGPNKDRVLEFYQNGTYDTITCIGVRGINDRSDPMTDYCAFVFYSNLTQALRLNS